MTDQLLETRLWAEALQMPVTLRSTVEKADGFDELAALLSGPDVRRIVATGNGAGYYAALALWLASLESPRPGPEVVPVPAGLIAGGFRWREGDVPLVISSSGALRDAIDALTRVSGMAYGAITAHAEAPIGAGAAARAIVTVESQDAVTHTQGFCGNVVAALSVWARVTGDVRLEQAAAAASDHVADALAIAPGWAAEMVAELSEPSAVVAFGSGPAWAAALETALVAKEVARVPAEGFETREGATSGMYALDRGHLVMSFPAGDPDELLNEAESTCRATGADVVRVPGGEGNDRRLAPVTCFAAALALGIELGLLAGRDVDQPAWFDAYLATARITTAETEDT